jgi:muconolactone D-isomerase
MLYLVHMRVSLPTDLDEAISADLKSREKALAQELQRDGRWKELWRVVGEYANYSVFDVRDHDELHELLSSLPLFPYMEVRVTPLARHPSRI